MIKLIASDLDGTIVPEGTFAINPRYEEVFSKLIDRGIVVVLASGRHVNNMKKLMPLIEDKAYFLSDNGATLVHKNEILIKHHLKKDTVKNLLDYLHDDMKCEVALSNDIGYYTEERDKYINENVFTEKKEVGHIVKNVHEYLQNVTKLTVMASDKVKEVIASLKKKYDEELAIVQSGTIWCDITLKGVSKGTGLKFIKEKLSIDKSECVGFGNSENDIALLNECQTAYVVDDSNEKVKSVATKIIPDVYNDGPLIELEKILKECDMKN